MGDNLQAIVTRLETEIEVLKQALRPFAAVSIPDNWNAAAVLAWEEMEGPHGYYPRIKTMHIDCNGGPTVGDYRRAREVLGTTPGESTPSPPPEAREMGSA